MEIQEVGVMDASWFLLSSIEGLGSEGGTGNDESGFGEENRPGWEFHLAQKLLCCEIFVSEAEAVDWGSIVRETETTCLEIKL
jgi:hypothetical protein